MNTPRRFSGPRGGWDRSPFRLVFLLTLLLGFAACGGSDPTGTDEPDPALAPFVGDWEAVAFTVTSDADPEVWFDVTDGGAFSINVQPSGQYTAILSFPSLPTPVVELGEIQVIGASLRLNPQGGDPVTSSFEFDGPNRFTLDGPTEFDFNQDGELDPAEAHIELVRSGS